jgi:DNA-binding NtrC family response regulator
MLNLSKARPPMSVDDHQRGVEPADAYRAGIDCVCLTCFAFSIEFLATMLRSSGIRFHCAETVEQADFLLTATAGTVLLSDVVFLDGCWANAVDMLAHFHPDVVALVVADTMDRQFVAEALEAGVSCIIWRPIDTGQLARTLHAAHEASQERRLRTTWAAEAALG